MIESCNGKKTPDKDVVFVDGVLTILYLEKKCGDEWKVERVYLDAQYDKPITLVDIVKKYPYVKKVIYDKALEGYVYNYKNHIDRGWELVGTTVGYA